MGETGDRGGPPRHEVHVWYSFTGSLGPGELESLESLLTTEERARKERFQFARDRRDFAAAHALLRRALSTCGPESPQAWMFETSGHGKPQLVQRQAGWPPLVFSLSHTDGLVACAVAHGTDVGVDVERMRDRATASQIAPRYFAPIEVQQLEACSADEYEPRFIEFWTLKESYMKAVGVGLHHPLHSFAFEFEGARRLRFHPPPDVNARGWQFALLAPSAQYRLAVAIRCDEARPRWNIAWRNETGPTESSARTRSVRSGAARGQ